MPITKSAKKAVRQNSKRKKRNLGYKRKIKSLEKEAMLLISQKKIKEVKDILPKIYKTVDKSAKKGIIKKNTAGRKKSRIANLINRKSSQ
ncbi:MAG: 30S ribosomal protein S20 [Patescibacteria group bacterium]|nr:30S ribosomal protein S20 [Patescibacteria group bacterium]